MQFRNCLYYCKSFDSQTVVEAKFNRADCGKFKKGVAFYEVIYYPSWSDRME